MVANETNIHSIRYCIRITKLHNKWNGMEWIFVSITTICQISPFISLTSESETNVELHPRLKLTNINLSKIF